MGYAVAAFIYAIGASVVKRILVALGIGLMTYAGFASVQGQIQSAIDFALGSAPMAVYQIIALGGMVDAVGIWLGALSAAVVLLSLKRFTAFPLLNP